MSPSRATVWIPALLAIALVGAACDGGGEPERAAPSPAATVERPEGSPDFGTGRALIATDDGSVLIDVEIADTPEEHAFGLMHRESMPEDHGMAFMFFEESGGGFWMKNTLIPLSIAFFDEDGHILAIMDMDPCEEDPCPVYDPGVSYWGALEVNQSAFERWGVTEGDRVTVVPGAAM